MVYRTIAGEKPLWDFPDGFLAHREVSACLVSEVLGWIILPHIWLRDGPLGEGIVQLWQETDPGQNAVYLVPAEDVPDTGWKELLQGQDETGRIVFLVHEDTPGFGGCRPQGRPHPVHG